MRTYKFGPTAFFLMLFALSVISCKKDFLNIVPKGKLVATKFEDYDLLMNSTSFYTFSGVGIWQAAMLMGDDVSAEESQMNSSGVALAKALFQWNDEVFIADPNAYGSENPLFMRFLLSNMYILNKIIDEVENSTGGTPQLKLKVKSEAMAARAFANFQLINFFGKPYLASSASTDPGFPIITDPDITQTEFSRSTVQAVYDFIISDLQTAISGLPVQSNFPTRWSRAAAEGFLGKVYLFMGKNTEALPMLNAAFSDISAMSRPPMLYDYNETFAAGGAFQPFDPIYGYNTPLNTKTDVTESVVTIFSYAGNYDGNGFGSDFLTIAEETKNLFDPADLRLNLYTDLQPDQTPNPGGRLRRFAIPYSFVSRIGLELPDLYLLRAEVKARSNDLPGAVQDLEALRTKRMPAVNATVPNPIATNQNALLHFIIDERTREFAQLGYHWWDMRRLSVDPLFAGQPAPKHLIYLTAGGTTEYTLRPERLTLRIPKFYMDAHPEMTNNP